MTSDHKLRFAKIAVNFGTGAIPALGFGTLIPDLAETKIATTNALRVGFRHLDCAERYRKGVSPNCFKRSVPGIDTNREEG
jgi:diketogulonate reductase-like aldo/keto reductase